jgi:hypothetical protein
MYDYDYATTLIAEFVIDIAWLAYSWTCFFLKEEEELIHIS